MSPEKSPTMIIPRGTDIEVDVHGQLTIRTPGNLVIQDSGNFATLESLHGSIRIESSATVEAVHVRCAETCFIEGTLTAWKVTADAIHLEDSARANIVLQETQRMDIGHGARMVGNFQDDKELFYLFSRFAGELRALPIFSERNRVGRGDRPEASADDLPQVLLVGGEGDGEQAVEAEVEDVDATEGEGSDAALREDTGDRNGPQLPDALFFSLVILERELGRPTYGPSSQRAIEELVKLLRDGDLETLRLTHRTLFGRIVEPGKDVQRVHKLIEEHFLAFEGGSSQPPE
jgi:hypothetical protein